MNSEIHRVENTKGMYEALESLEWDAILCDYMMPQFTVDDAMQIVREKELDIPFIIVSGTISDEDAVSMMKAGAHDYLTKNNLSRLVPAIKREIAEARSRAKRRIAEKALRDSELRHRTLVESLSDTVIVIDPNSIVSEFYSNHPLLNNLSIEEHLGKPLHDLFPSSVSAKLSECAGHVSRENQSLVFQYPLQMNGKQIWYSAKMSRHRDGQRIVVVIRDVTDLKNALDEARASHAVAMLYQDITGHDIRNSLQAILIASDLLYADEEDQSKQALINHITDSIAECSELITTVQATADLLTAPLERTSLDFTLKGCLEMFAEENEDVKLESEIKTKNAIVQADRYLCRMIMNVLSNATKYNEAEEKHVWTHLSEDEKGFTVAIADNGPGIRDDLKKNLLNPERRAGGVGIHQCMQIASKYGGRFDIRDRVEGDFSKGAKVVIWLPKTGEMSG